MPHSFVANQQGRNVQLWARWQQEYGDQGLSSNIVVPCFGTPGYVQDKDLGSEMGAKALFRVLVANPADARRMAQAHTSKDGSFAPIMFDGIISTTDRRHWQDQRKALSEVFVARAL